MKLRSKIASAVIAATALGSAAQTPWIHVYLNETKSAEGPIGFPSMPVRDIRSFQFTRSGSNFRKMNLEGSTGKFSIDLANVNHWEIAPNVPTFRIATNPIADDVFSKEEYLDGTLTIDGAGLVDDFTGEMLIRGRGNSTWNYPKKAYRVKFPVKTKICGFRKAKNFVLLANHIDPTFMRNHVAFSAAQLAGMPYPNHAMAVDVYFNDALKGSYMLTEKCGFNNGSVDLTKEDEAKSIMFELDTNFDEDFRSVSPLFALPVNLKDPDAPADPEAAKLWWSTWMADFERMEEAVFNRNGIADHIDYTSLARYLLVFNLTCNQELDHPKSVYLYKTEGGKYQFGPAWDFDWAFGYMPIYRTETGNALTPEERRALIDRALQLAYENRWDPNDDYAYFEMDGTYMIWTGGESFLAFTGSGYVSWPDNMKQYAPSYQNYLLGYGSNNNNPGGMGNGGEFFLSIVKDNPEFIAEYERVWNEFRNRLPEFWAAFDAYAARIKPSYERDVTVWGQKSPDPGDIEFSKAEYSREGAIQVLRTWVEKRIEFISDPANNYGLFDPACDYVPVQIVIPEK